MRFDLSTIRNINEVKWASLSLNGHGMINANFWTDIWGLNDDVSGQDWDEANITHNNAPGNAANNDLDGGETTQLAASCYLANSLENTGTMEYSNTNIVNFIQNDTDGLVTFIIRRTSGDATGNAGFSSREAGFAPVLKLYAITEATRQCDHIVLGKIFSPFEAFALFCGYSPKTSFAVRAQW